MKITVIILAAVIVVLLGVLIFVPSAKSPTQPGGGTPSQAVMSADGHLAVTLPHPSDAIASPVAIEGTVTGGGWFFEASFPIEILDGNGTIIGQGTAQALSDWMSTGTVPFSASIPFTAPQTSSGTIRFKADNPSGLPQNDKSLALPVRFEVK